MNVNGEYKTLIKFLYLLIFTIEAKLMLAFGMRDQSKKGNKMKTKKEEKEREI